MGCTHSSASEPAPSARKPSLAINSTTPTYPAPNLAGVGQPALSPDLNSPVYDQEVKQTTKTLIATTLRNLLNLQAFMQDHPPSTFTPAFREQISHQLSMMFDVMANLQIRCKEICMAHGEDGVAGCEVCKQYAEAREKAKWEEKRRVKSE